MAWLHPKYDGRSYDTNKNEPETPNENRPPVAEQPRNIRLSNSHNKEQEVLVNVVFEGEEIYEEKHKVRSNSSKVIEEITDEVGSYTITASLETGEEVEENWGVSDASTAALVETSEREELTVIRNPEL